LEEQNLEHLEMPKKLSKNKKCFMSKHNFPRKNFMIKQPGGAKRAEALPLAT